jgi:hypothetical protein
MLSRAWENVAKTYDPDHPFSVNFGDYKGLKRADNLAAFGMGAVIASEIRGLASFKSTGSPKPDEVEVILNKVFSDKEILTEGVTNYNYVLGKGQEIGPDALTFIEYYGGFNTASLRIDPKLAPYPSDNMRLSPVVFMHKISPAYEKAMSTKGIGAIDREDTAGIGESIKGMVWVFPNREERLLNNWLRKNLEDYSKPQGLR